ncbi:MAG: PQQ-binding-like beta-propeller repeat protein, partial [bacterium]|nr:PQQ-binding-like beta-propeller repeat protein [bacterium]
MATSKPKTGSFNFKATKWFRLPDAPTKKGNKTKRWILGTILSFIFTLGIYIFWTSPIFPNLFLLFHEPLSSLESQSKAGDWSVNGGNLGHTKYVSAATAPKGKIRWSSTFTENTDSAPSIAGDVLYVGDHFKISALRSGTGVPLWHYPTTGPVHSSPAVAGQYIYFGLLDGRMIALNRHDGHLEWEFNTDNYVASSPIVVKGIVYIGTGSGTIYALDAKSGDLIWQRKIGRRLKLSPSYFDDTLYLTTSARGIYSLSAKTGAQKLYYRVPGNIADTPVAANNLVYFTSRTGILHTCEHGVFEIPGLYGFQQFLEKLYGMGLPVPVAKPQSGTQWSFSPRSHWNRFNVSPAVTPERLFIGDNSGR